MSSDQELKVEEFVGNRNTGWSLTINAQNKLVERKSNSNTTSIRDFFKVFKLHQTTFCLIK